MQNNASQRTEQQRDSVEEMIRAKRTKLNLQILGLTAIHLLLLTSWVGLSRLNHRSPRMLLGLLILTALTWLWLVVTASRRFGLWRKCEQEHTE
ncbi:hypothetical protein hmeg3_11965 [Herbaspirillum sp. meg3]|uniref:hypothetical protein n=1 Tax=Herbaspirillum sp. meg3 TaxID=2025949 RepID=UPI000B98AE40|nr:hypothetical protein [Herbaspirillum sp. meg3]ASU38929.1 hypothetical protein hmeg3_11965 [Herbaspirillum sp. meg3]